MIERERKFLVDPSLLPPDLGSFRMIEAGYLTSGAVAVRVTMSSSGACKVCLKGPGTVERTEFETSLPRDVAQEFLDLSPTYLRKRRYDHEGWEIDEFDIPGVSLWVAEWEEAEGKGPVPDPPPAWIVREVTDDVSYQNQRLARTHGVRSER